MEQNQLERMELGTVIGNNIHDLRTLRGMSQEALGLAAGLQQSYIGKLERGEILPGAAILMRLARALEVCVGSLFERDPYWRHSYQKCPYSKELEFSPEQLDSMFRVLAAIGGAGGAGENEG